MLTGSKVHRMLVAATLVFLLAIAINAWVNIRNIDDLTLYQINQRRSYFPKPIARIMSNKLFTAINLSVKKVFTIFPRE